MNKNIPTFDLPVNFIMADDITGKQISQYTGYPYKVEAEMFMLVTKGTARVSINLKEYDIKPNDFTTLIAGSFIQLHEVSPDIHLYVAGFSSEFMSSNSFVNTARHLLPIIIDNPVTSLEPDHVPPFEDLYKVFIKTYQPELAQNIEIAKAIKTLMTEAAYEIYKKYKELHIPHPSREHEIYRSFQQLAMQHYKEQHGVSFYADALGLSLPHFCTTIRKATGNKPLDIISSILIMDAKAHLKNTNMPVKEIAVMLGFNNLSFFNKFFKRFTGMTPKGYRNQ